MTHEVTVFTGAVLVPGQKIRIEDSPRAGDWEVISVTPHKVTLRCPVSGREFTWDRFCYCMSLQNRPWPDTRNQ